MQPATAAASTERIMRQKVKIDHGYAENDAKKKKHGHKNISPTVSGFSIGDEDDDRTEENPNQMSDVVPSAINRALAQETATGMFHHHTNPLRQTIVSGVLLHTLLYTLFSSIRCTCTVFLWRCG